MNPSGLPIISPIMIASMSSSRPLKTSVVMATPAFASAKIGNTR